MRKGDRMLMEMLKLLCRLPLPLRRRVLYGVWLGWLAFNWKRADFGTDAIVSRSLRMGRRETRRIGRDMHFHDQLVAMEWIASGLTNARRFAAEERYVTFEDAALFERIAATGDPVVLAPLHMGNISVGIAYIVKRFFPGRRILVLRSREDRDDQNQAVARLSALASELQILNTKDKARFVDAMRFARKGAVVICFADLPASYGTPAPVELFGEPAEIALGLDTLSRLVKGVVLPIAVKSSLTRDHVLTGRPFEVVGASAEERAEVAQLVSSQLQHFIYAAPAQWHFWERLGEFRPAEPSEEAPPSESLVHETA